MKRCLIIYSESFFNDEIIEHLYNWLSNQNISAYVFPTKKLETDFRIFNIDNLEPQDIEGIKALLAK